MKVKLLKLFCGHGVGSIVTMHPINARNYYKQGVCEALTDAEQAYLESGIVRRGRIVETQVRSKATEDTTITPEKIRKPRKPRDKTAKRRKS